MLNVQNFQPTVKRKNKSDGFAELLRESSEFFQQSNIQMVAGFKEIISEDGLFSEYVSRLTDGLEPDEAEQLEQILENARLDILAESTVSQVTPLVGLSMPTVRKMWVKTALKNAIPTETAKVPSFTISWMEPYLRDADGTKHALPASVRGASDHFEKPKLHDGWLTVPADGENIMDKTIINGVAASQVNHDAIDPILFVESVQIETTAADGTTKELKEVRVDAKMSIENGFYGVAKAANGDNSPVSDTFFGTINLETGEYTFACVKGLIKNFKFRGHLTQENNTRTQSVSFDVRRKDIRIGTGAHINAPLPIEWLQDTLALYNIDATVEVVDLMSNVVAQKLDQEIIEFFDASFRNSGSPFTGVFDVKPTAGFAGSPTEWRHELRTTIEWWATKLKSYTLFTNGYFVIYGNPLDVNLIPDINWQFKAVQGERGGVNVNYDFGVLTANNVYQVVASDNVPQGELVMFFVPNVDNYMTYKYYPYTFNVEKGYLDPQMPNVPSIMMTKRHTIEELIPMQVRITIKNNDGNLISAYRL